MFFLEWFFYTSARVDSTTVVATSLWSKSSSHDGIDCSTTGFDWDTVVLIGSDVAGTLTAAVSVRIVGFSGLTSSSCRDGTFN